MAASPTSILIVVATAILMMAVATNSQFLGNAIPSTVHLITTTIPGGLPLGTGQILNLAGLPCRLLYGTQVLVTSQTTAGGACLLNLLDTTPLNPAPTITSLTNFVSSVQLPAGYCGPQVPAGSTCSLVANLLPGVNQFLGTLNLALNVASIRVGVQG